jgi:DNA polymerase IV
MRDATSDRLGVQAWTATASRSAFQVHGNSRSSSWTLVRPETTRSSTSVSQAKGSTPLSFAVATRLATIAQWPAPPSEPANKAFLRPRLAPLSIDKVWGIGPQTAAFLIQHGLPTALSFARTDQTWVEAHLTKPHREIWHELRGTLINFVTSEKKTSYKSISKTRTFTSPTKERELVFSQLSKNIELACGKARMYHLSTRHIFAFIKTQDFRFHGFEVTLDKPTSLPEPIVHTLRPEFESMYMPRALYRGIGVFLTELEPDPIQPDLLGEHIKLERLERVHQRLDELTMKYGKHIVYLGSSHKAMQRGLHTGERDIPAMRQHQELDVERKRRIFNLPFLGDVH